LADLRVARHHLLGEGQTCRALVLEVTKGSGKVQASINTVFLDKASSSLDALFLGQVRRLVVVREGEAHRGATRTGEHTTRVASVCANEMRRRNDDDNSCATTELRHALSSIILRRATEGVSTAMLILDLPQAGSALRLVHHHIHFAEAF